MAIYDCRMAAREARVVDAAGRPVANATLHLRQISHDFMFGCGAFDAIPYANGAEDPAWKDRVEKWLGLFNYGTLPFYWGRYEPVEGEPSRDSLMNAAKLLVERGARVKGHPLCWHTVCADWLMKYDDKTILDKQLARIHREVTTFAGVIDIWDVINEAVIMPVFDRYDNAVTRICRRYGREALIKEVFTAAKAANPNALLLINDFNLSDAYADLIARCLDAGVPIGAIGLQTHQHQGYMGAEKLQCVLRRFERFGLPLHFTENTLVSGHLMPGHIVDLNDYQVPEWPTTPEGEARQAEQMMQMYELLLAHPLVEAITNWDFADGAWLGAPSGLITKDRRKKPAYEALDELIHKRLHTECDVCTDGEGKVALKGYKGGYVLSLGARAAKLRIGGEAAGEVVLC